MEGAKAIRWHGTAAGRPGRAPLARRGAHDREAPVQLLAGDDGRHVFLSVEPEAQATEAAAIRNARHDKRRITPPSSQREFRPGLHAIAWDSRYCAAAVTYKSAERVTNVQAPDRMKPTSVAECSPPQALRSTGSRRRARPDLLRQT